MAVGARQARAFDEVYKTRFRFFYGPEDVFVRAANRAFGGTPIEPHNAQARCIVGRIRGAHHAWIWLNACNQLRGTLTVAALAHEAVHVAHGIFELIGVSRTDPIPEELLAYYQEWIVRTALKCLDPKGCWR